MKQGILLMINVNNLKKLLFLQQLISLTGIYINLILKKKHHAIVVLCLKNQQ